MDNNICISFCISTFYERGHLIKNTIESIVLDPDFDSSIEVIVIDNGSTDNTSEICSYFERKYPNFHYYKNEKNLGDKNFEMVLKKGKGIYLKFLNDTQKLKPGTLRLLKEKVIENYGKDTNVLFIEKTRSIKQKGIINCANKESILNNISYNTTWSGNFGAYRSFFNQMNNVDRAAKLRFLQVDWIYNLAEDRKTSLYVDNYYDVQVTYKKGTWNFVEVFTNNYFGVLKFHFKWGLLLEKEKWRVFRYHLIPFLYTLYFKKKYEYDSSHSLLTLFKHYWYNPLCYAYSFVYFTTKIFKGAK